MKRAPDRASDSKHRLQGQSDGREKERENGSRTVSLLLAFETKQNKTKQDKQWLWCALARSMHTTPKGCGGEFGAQCKGKQNKTNAQPSIW